MAPLRQGPDGYTPVPSQAPVLADQTMLVSSPISAFGGPNNAAHRILSESQEIYFPWLWLLSLTRKGVGLVASGGLPEAT